MSKLSTVTVCIGPTHCLMQAGIGSGASNYLSLQANFSIVPEAGVQLCMTMMVFREILEC